MDREKICHLPLETVKNSAGFSLDLGSSITKIVIRSREDFSKGVPSEKLGEGALGRVHLMSYPKSDIKDAISYIKDNCDINRDGQERIEINVTGACSQLYKEQIEKELNCKVNIKVKVDMVVDGFILTNSVLSTGEIFYPLSQDMISVAKKRAKMFLSMDEEGNKEIIGRVDIETNPSSRPVYPCLLVTCGSKLSVLKVEEDGTFYSIDDSTFAGEELFALSSLLTGNSNFEEIVQMTKNTDGRTADVFSLDLVDTEAGSDVYSDMPDIRVFALGKAIHEKKESIKKEDIAFSLVTSMCEHFSAVVQSCSAIHNTKAVYLCGSMINIRQMRDQLTNHLFISNLMQPQERQYQELQFLNYGSHLAALGAFLESSVKQKMFDK